MESMNIYCVPTPYIGDGNGGQQTGYIAANVVLDDQGHPVTDENGVWITD